MRVVHRRLCTGVLLSPEFTLHGTREICMYSRVPDDSTFLYYLYIRNRTLALRSKYIQLGKNYRSEMPGTFPHAMLVLSA